MSDTLHQFIQCLVNPWLIRRLMMKRIINVANGVVQQLVTLGVDLGGRRIMKKSR